jgi:hypothetical protein
VEFMDAVDLSRFGDSARIPDLTPF